jgi:hypothetical protein
MKVIVAATRSNDPEVHRAGCADVARGRKSGKYQAAYSIEVEEVEGAALWFWSDFIPDEMSADDAQGYTRYLPCTDGL